MIKDDLKLKFINKYKKELMDKNIIGFWGHSKDSKYAYLSNWYQSNFNIEKVEFCNVEQYLMYQKALCFKDEIMAVKILNNKNPKEIKTLGRQVKNYNDVEWDKIRYNVLKIALKAKFTQNELLLSKLKQTNNSVLVEASPYDKIWGIGMDVNHEYKDYTKWQGTNLLGWALTEIKNEI